MEVAYLKGKSVQLAGKLLAKTRVGRFKSRTETVMVS